MPRCLDRRGVISLFHVLLGKPFSRTLTTALASATPHQYHLDNKTEQNRELVAELLNSYGFSNTQVDQLHAKWPLLARVRVEKNIKPKLQWLSQVGFTSSEIPKMVVTNSTILRGSLDNRLKRNFEFLRYFTGSTEAIRNLIGRNNLFLTYDLKKTVIPNTAHLVDLGVPGARIFYLLANHSRVLMGGHGHFVQAVERVCKWGIDPRLSLFAHAVRAVGGLNGPTLESRLNLYRSMGWSEDDIGLAVRRAPLFLLVSEDKIKKSADFFTNTVGLKPSCLFTDPRLLMYGLEKRIIPRFAVMQALKSKGVFQNRSGDRMNVGLFTCSEMVFLKRYVRRHVDEVPELMEIYPGGGKVQVEEIAKLNKFKR